MPLAVDAVLEKITLADILRAAAMMSEGATCHLLPGAKSGVWIGKEGFHPKWLIVLASRRYLPRELTRDDFTQADNRRITKFFADLGFKIKVF